jgi:hypothetical protein
VGDPRRDASALRAISPISRRARKGEPGAAGEQGTRAAMDWRDLWARIAQGKGERGSGARGWMEAGVAGGSGARGRLVRGLASRRKAESKGRTVHQKNVDVYITDLSSSRDL